AGAADRTGRRRRRAEQGSGADDGGGCHGCALFLLEAFAEEGGRENLVPAFERLLARAVGVEERLERVDRLRELLAEAARLGVVGPAGDGGARGHRVGDDEVPVQPITDGNHGVVERAILAVVRAKLFGRQNRDTKAAKDRAAPAIAAAG